eukprot:928233-Amphidinium_carterae.2
MKVESHFLQKNHDSAHELASAAKPNKSCMGQVGAPNRGMNATLNASSRNKEFTESEKERAPSPAAGSLNRQGRSRLHPKREPLTTISPPYCQFLPAAYCHKSV